MAVLTFPLAKEGFWLNLPIGTDTFELSRAVDVARTRGGEVIASEIGASLWTGKIEIAVMTHGEARAVTPLLNLLSRPGATFAVCHSARLYPRFDATGSILGASTPTVLALGSDPRELSLTGLPAAYPLSAGDLIGFTYSGTRVAIHEIVSAVTANGSGQTALFEVNPPLRPGLTTGTAVRLKQPYCTAVLQPGSLSLGKVKNVLTSGVSFEWTQTLRT